MDMRLRSNKVKINITCQYWYFMLYRIFSLLASLLHLLNILFGFHLQAPPSIPPLEAPVRVDGTVPSLQLYFALPISF